MRRQWTTDDDGRARTNVAIKFRVSFDDLVACLVDYSQRYGHDPATMRPAQVREVIHHHLWAYGEIALLGGGERTAAHEQAIRRAFKPPNGSGKWNDRAPMW
jgi:hypothetical protein